MKVRGRVSRRELLPSLLAFGGVGALLDFRERRRLSSSDTRHARHSTRHVGLNDGHCPLAHDLRDERCHAIRRTLRGRAGRLRSRRAWHCRFVTDSRRDPTVVDWKPPLHLMRLTFGREDDCCGSRDEMAWARRPRGGDQIGTGGHLSLSPMGLASASAQHGSGSLSQ